jgi:tetraacyldisaccharide 4'-kinase
MNASDLLYGNSGAARVARTVLRPLSSAYGFAVGIRNWLYDSSHLKSREARIPVISIGNISAGGTGKTPVTAWLAARFAAAGEKPAIVMRGYGSDEPMVHAHLNPDIPVVVDAVRVRGVETAEKAGATIALLDDAFQHRSIQRDADIVLISAERWNEGMLMLPSGDLREPLSALARASYVLVTRKSASRDRALAIEKAVRSRFRNLPVGIAWLAPAALRDRNGNEVPLHMLEGAWALAFSAVGDNGAFQRQLRETGAKLHFKSFRDHYRFSPRDLQRLAAASKTVQYSICTLKDAVKLWPKWPADAKPLWYVSQALVLESGAGALDELIAGVTAKKRL